MRDEFPGRAYLTVPEVRRLLALHKAKDFRDFLEENADFPKPVKHGKSANGQPRMMYLKHRVYAFIDLHGG